MDKNILRWFRVYLDILKNSKAYKILYHIEVQIALNGIGDLKAAALMGWAGGDFPEGWNNTSSDPLVRVVLIHCSSFFY